MKGNEEEQRKIFVESIIYDDSKMEACLAMVGRRIHAERIRQRVSISRLAELSNLSISCISKAETDQCRISLKALIKIAAALNVPVWQFLDIDESYLLGGTEESQNLKDCTNGERFEQIMKPAGEKTTALILDMVDELMRAMNREDGEEE